MHERFVNLLNEHKKILYKICNAYCRQRDDREDLAQEIVVQLWRSFASFDNRCLFATWMYRISLNVAISFFRRENTRAHHILSDDELLLNIADESAAQVQEMQPLYEYIDHLDPLNRALILLYLDGNSYLEIAAILGISETSVGTKINRLKQKGKKQ